MADEETGTSLTSSERLARLRLIRTDNVGPQTFRQLLAREGSGEAALAALPRLLRKLGAPLRIPSQTEAEDELAGLAAIGGRLVADVDPDYPPLLRFIGGAPPLVSLRGALGLELRHTVGMVGARNASAAGQKMAQRLARQLGRAGYLVVSGLARGIDAAAHRASLETGTVAVLAGGLDRIYPQEHAALAEEIAERGGLLITEMPLHWEPRARDFPRRNRLVSGLSLGVVVVEAAQRSGSLITARLALEQDRDVFAVPGSPLDPRAEGGNMLIQQGAKLVTSGDDILEALEQADPGRRQLFAPDWHASEATTVDAEPPGDVERQRLLSALSVTPTAVDELIRTTDIPVGAMQMLLLGLDLEGRLEWSGQLVALRG